MKNIVDAIITLVNQNEIHLKDSSVGNNRLNIVGYALEDYVKNLFADTFACSESKRLEKLSEVFSYLGNDSNPPDMMLKFGDALEVKKIQSDDSAIALNSSYPKHKLTSDSSMISKACRECEDWFEKDIIYLIGVVKNNILKQLCMVYGKNYCASSECYERILNLKGIDPLNATDLIFNGKWYVKNPFKVFDYVYIRDRNAKFNFMCLIDSDKWIQFDNRDRLIELQKAHSNLKIRDVKIKNPDNPAKLDNAKLIDYKI